MTSIIPPRYEIPLMEAGGRMNRDWYKYLASLGSAINFSPTSTDDAIVLASVDDAEIQAAVTKARQTADLALAQAFLSAPADQKIPDDVSLLAWWPQ